MYKIQSCKGKCKGILFYLEIRFYETMLWWFTQCRIKLSSMHTWAQKLKEKLSQKTCWKFSYIQHIWKTFHATLAAIFVAKLMGFKIRVPNNILVKYLLVFKGSFWHQKLRWVYSTHKILISASNSFYSFLTSPYCLAIWKVGY